MRPIFLAIWTFVIFKDQIFFANWSLKFLRMKYLSFHCYFLQLDCLPLVISNNHFLESCTFIIFGALLVSVISSLYEKKWKLFCLSSKKMKFWIFSNKQNCFAYISATKYHSEAVLYSKRTAGYPLSPHIKTFAVVFLQAE